MLPPVKAKSKSKEVKPDGGGLKARLASLFGGKPAAAPPKPITVQVKPAVPAPVPVTSAPAASSAAGKPPAVLNIRQKLPFSAQVRRRAGQAGCAGRSLPHPGARSRLCEQPQRQPSGWICGVGSARPTLICVAGATLLFAAPIRMFRPAAARASVSPGPGLRLGDDPAVDPRARSPCFGLGLFLDLVWSDPDGPVERVDPAGVRLCHGPVLRATMMTGPEPIDDVGLVQGDGPATVAMIRGLYGDRAGFRRGRRASWPPSGNSCRRCTCSIRSPAELIERFEDADVRFR